MFLTKEGKKLNRRLGTVTRRARERLVKDLTPGERSELIRLLRKLLNIEDEGKSASQRTAKR